MNQRAFSLLEVMVALGILAISLGVLLNANVSAIASVERIEGMTQATLLGRAKVLDLERELNKEGFKVDEEDRDGTFEKEGHHEIHWKAKISPIKLQVDKLMDFAQDLAIDDKDKGKKGPKDKADKTKTAKADPSAPPSANDPLAFLQPLMAPVAQTIGDNMRLVQLEVSWPEGKYRGKFTVNAIVTSKILKQVAPPGMPGASGLLPGGIPGIGAIPGAIPGGIPGVIPSVAK